MISRAPALATALLLALALVGRLEAQALPVPISPPLPVPAPVGCLPPEPGPGPPPTPRPLPVRPFPEPPAVAAAPADTAGQSSADAYPFPITRHRVSGLWLQYLRTHGDVDVLGLPRSEVICDPLTGQVVQYFQRLVLEYHPEQSLAYRIQRRLLVADLYPGPADAPADGVAPPGPDAFYFAPGPRGLGHWLSDYAPDGSEIGFKRFFDARGREDTFGYPIEEPKVRSGLWTQRFQAAVFEYHPENVRPGLNAAGIPIRNYGVQLELLGDEYIAKYNLGLR
ncbi:MAG TPA: hypothetical protein VGL23_12005 [Chloroflexota bacterium]